tara:strand:+ start:174 stop:518 length:345 start_codon:yes stop_codon:yes gene_type:complete
MEYKWTVNKVQVAEDNLVVKVDLTVTGTENGSSASAAYTRTLTRGDSFIPFEQLTEQQVLDWCFAPEVIDIKDRENNIVDTITSYLKEDGEAQVSNQIARQLAQKQIEPALPWL